MTWLVVVIASAIELLAGKAAALRSTAWIPALDRWLGGLLGQHAWWNGPIGVLVTLGLPLLLVVGVHAWLLESNWLLGLLFALAVTVYCLGPRDLDGDIDRYLAAGDDAERALAASGLSGGVLGNAEGDAARVPAAILIEAHDRVFAPLVWLVILGPAGIVLFRMVEVLRAGHTDPAREGVARHLYDILAWVPARLLVLGFAIGGSLTHAFDAWRSEEDFTFASTSDILVNAGLAALEADERAPADEAQATQWTVRATRGLIYRAFVAWIAVLSVASLF